MKKYTQKQNIYDTITQSIITQLDAGVVPWHKPWAGGMPSNYISNAAYRGVNVLSLEVKQIAAGYDSNNWLTFAQAKNSGGYIKAGEKGTGIIFWKFFNKEVKDDTSGEVRVDSVPMAKGYTVFNLCQCSGLKPKDTIEIDCIGAADSIISGYNGAPQIDHGGDRAFYVPSSDRVQIPLRNSFETSEAYYSTMFHELTHSTGHESRLDRSIKNNFGDSLYSQEELVAELGAAFLMGMTGGELIAKTIDNSAAYIETWRRRISEDNSLIVKAASAAQKAADYIQGEKD